MYFRPKVFCFGPAAFDHVEPTQDIGAVLREFSYPRQQRLTGAVSESLNSGRGFGFTGPSGRRKRVVAP